MTHEELEKQVIEVLETIRPQLQADGGDLEFISMDEENRVYARMVGACGSCPMATMELKSGIEQYLKDACPDVKEIIQA